MRAMGVRKNGVRLDPDESSLTPFLRNILDTRATKRLALGPRAADRRTKNARTSPDTLMARQPRYVIPGQPQHVIQRGNNRSAMFVGIEDYLFFQECLADACERHGCAVHAYVFMTIHIHVIMSPSARHAIAKTMQSVGRR